MSAEPCIPRTVKPRKTSYAHLPIIAVSLEDQQVLTETGELFTLSSLPGILAACPPSLVVNTGSARLLRYLDNALDGHPQWQFRISPDKREIWRPNATFHRRTESIVVHFFGFQRADGHRGPGRFHYPLDPVLFARKTIHELLPTGDAPTVGKLLTWGKDVRAFCERHNLKLSPTNGGLAGQLLRDPRFFPQPRRKIPGATNARARPTLAGNYYRLFAPERKTYSATYLDMQTAHHNIAASLTFPDPDTLMARGRFIVTGDTDVTDSGNAPWAMQGTRTYNALLQSHGLLYVRLTVPHLPKGTFPPPYMERPGSRMAWIYTNEIPMIRKLGGVIDWLVAGWTSFDTAPGLNTYAWWAMRETALASLERRVWLKPTLLATYGVLASKPRVQEFAFKRARGGTPQQYPAGSGMLTATAMVGDIETEIPTANVIYRGLIEAEQRVRSLDMARMLHAHGHRVLSIYADSVFVESGPQLPLLPPPWRIESELDRLQFFSATSFTSAQLTKLPGIPRDALDRLRRLDAYRRAA